MNFKSELGLESGSELQSESYLGLGSELDLDLESETARIQCVSFRGLISFFVVGGDLFAALNNLGTAESSECFGKMIRPIRCCGFHCQVSLLDEMFFYLLLVLEARAAVDITVVRKVFLLDKTFDLLCPSTAVGFTVTSVGSFRFKSFLVPSLILKRGRFLLWASPSFVGCSYLTKPRLSSSPS